MTLPVVDQGKPLVLIQLRRRLQEALVAESTRHHCGVAAFSVLNKWQKWQDTSGRRERAERNLRYEVRSQFFASSWDESGVATPQAVM